MNGHEESLTGGGEELGEDIAEGRSATGDGGYAAISLMPDVCIFEISQLEGSYVLYGF